MGNSLQDQLLKTGLVDEKRLQQSQKALKKERKQQPKAKKRATPEQSELQRQLAEEEAMRRQREQQLNEQRRQQAEQKAKLAEVRQLIARHKIEKEVGECCYNFVDKGKVKRFHITTALRDSIVAGKLAIVKIDGLYELVKCDIAAKLPSAAPRA